MRISQIGYNNNLHNNIAFTSAASDSKKYRAAIQRCPVSAEDVTKIIELIQKSDESRLDGTPQGLYQYSKFMVKTPDVTTADTTVKEFFALTRIGQIQGQESIAPIPGIVSKSGNTHFLVEEFIQGYHKDGKKLTLDEVLDIMKKLTIMDKGGIINNDLSPRNIMYLEDGSQKIVDFDHFVFLGEDGRVFNSQSTPTRYFITRIDKSALHDVENANVAGTKVKDLCESTIESRFANSFLHKRRVPQGIHDLSQARNMSENPYINVPSNLTNYEARTIYRKIKDSDIDDPIEFLQNYIQLKAQRYHTQMRDFLKTLNIIEDTGISEIPFYEAEKQLANAIDYEEFLINLFGKEKPDLYFIKLEAAKIQLEAFLHTDDINRNTSNKERLHAAYEGLIRVITEGMDLYSDDERYSKYLNAELARYRDAFANTDFSISSAKKSAIGSFDILDVWFSDRGTDIKSVPALRAAAKKAGIKSARGLFKGAKQTAEASEQIIMEERGTILEAVEAKLREAGDRVTEKNLKKVANNIVDEIIVLIENGKLQRGSMTNPTTQSVSEMIANAPRVAKKRPPVIVSSIPAKIEGIVTGEAAESFYEQASRHNRYARQGGKIFAGLAVVAAIGGYAAYKVVQYKNEMKEQEAATERHNNLYKIKYMSEPVNNGTFEKFKKIMK